MENEADSMNVDTNLTEGSTTEQTVSAADARPSYYYFENFELDCNRRELRRDGMKIWLKGKAFTLLVLLVERGGQLITREEIRAHIWSPDTHVDFDSSVATTLRKIRNALGDSGKDPKFIETRHGLGYRFMPRVSVLKAQARVQPVVPMIPAPQRQLEPGAPPQAVAEETLPPIPEPFQYHRLILRALITVVFLIASVSSYALYRFAPRLAQTASHRTSVVVLPFVSESENPAADSFTAELTNELITHLAHVKGSELAIISATTAMHYKHSEKSVREITQELGVNYLLEGNVHRSNGQTGIVIRLIRARDQSVVWTGNYEEVQEALTSTRTTDMVKEIVEALSAQRGRNVA